MNICNGNIDGKHAEIVFDERNICPLCKMSRRLRDLEWKLESGEMFAARNRDGSFYQGYFVKKPVENETEEI